MAKESQKFEDAPGTRTVSKSERFLVIGSGSAGRRHALALRQIFPSAAITVVKRSTSKQPLETLRNSDVQIVDSLEDGVLNSPDFIVIASPATMHLGDIAYLSNHCPRFLLEKPTAATSHEAREIHAQIGRAHV